MKKRTSDVEYEMMDKLLRTCAKKAKTLPKVRRELNMLMEGLSPKERTIIELRYGIQNKKTGHSLRDTANKFGVTRERVLMIEKKAKERLKNARKKR